MNSVWDYIMFASDLNILFQKNTRDHRVTQTTLYDRLKDRGEERVCMCLDSVFCIMTSIWSMINGNLANTNIVCHAKDASFQQKISQLSLLLIYTENYFSVEYRKFVTG